MKDIEAVKTAKATKVRVQKLQAKWEKVLAELDLSMRRGESKKVDYGHDYSYVGLENGRYKSLGEIEKDGFSK